MNEEAAVHGAGTPVNPLAQWMQAHGVGYEDARRWMHLTPSESPVDGPLPTTRYHLFVLVACGLYGVDSDALAEWQAGAEEEHSEDPTTPFSAFFWRGAAIGMPLERFEHIESESITLSLAIAGAASGVEK